jgi:hypothetical protein
MLATFPNNTTNTFVAISEGGEWLGGGTSDNAVSKIKTDYEIGLRAAMASSIIHMNF